MEAKGPRSRGVETMCRKWVSERPMNPKNSFKNLPTSPATHSEAPNSFPLYTVPSSRIKLAWLTRFDDIFLPPLNYARGQFAISHSEGIRNLARDLMLSPRPPIVQNGAKRRMIGWHELSASSSAIIFVTREPSGSPRCVDQLEGKAIDNTRWNTKHGDIGQNAIFNEASHFISCPDSPTKKGRKAVMCCWAYLLFLPI